MKQKLLNNLRLRAVWLVAMILCAVTGAWADEVTYKLTIDASSFNTTSYAANNNEKTSNAVCVTDNTKTFEVKWTSNQVMKSGTNMQWQKSKGVIYNSTDLGTITKVTVTSSAGSFTTYYGEEAQPSSSTTVGNGFFQIKVGGATGTVSLIEVTFTITEGGDTNLKESNLALTDAPIALNFDLYDNSSAQVINYTTSSTGAVTVSESEYINTVVNAGSITVTPLKKTASAQTITVNQAADATYDAGSVTFTVNIDDSTPIPTHTATFSVNGATSTQDFEEGAAIVFPANPEDVNGKTFVGWVTEAIDGTTNDAPEFVTSATMGKANVTYYAVFATVVSNVTNVTDELTNDIIKGVENSYGDWNGKSITSTAVYAGNSAGAYNSIQLRSNNSNSGVITTTSGGTATKVVVIWNSNTLKGRTLNVYGSNSTYSAASNLYDAKTQGTLLGSIACGTNTELTIDGDYTFIGVRSSSGALYLDELSITWSSGSASVTDYCTNVAADTKLNAELSFAVAEVEANISEQYEAPTLTTAEGFNGTVEYESSDESVAQIMDAETGELRLLKEGTTTITATFAGNDDYKAGSASYTLTVIDNRIATTTTHENIVLDLSEVESLTQLSPVVKDAENNIIDCTYTEFPPKVSYEIVSDVNGLIGSIDNNSGEITLNKVVGTATIKASYNAFNVSNSYKPSECTFTITVESVQTITEVRTQGTGSVTTKGIVTSCSGTTAYIQDTEAAICVYGSALTVGDQVKVSGTLSTYKGLLEITSPTVTVLSQNNAVTPEVMTIAEINESENQGWLVKIENAIVTAIDGSNTTISQGENTVVVRSISSDVAVNDVITLTGNIGCYNTVQIANPTDVVVKVATPTFTPESSEVVVGSTVSISTTTADATIYYTTNGDEPTTESTLYSDPITINADMTIKAIAVKDGMSNSNVASASYTIIVTPTITVSTNSIEATVAGKDGTITVTYNNITEVEAEVVFCDSEGNAAEYEWITAEINNENNVYYVIGENTSTEARTAFIKVYALDDEAEDVYSEIITITQAGVVVDYATLPFAYDGNATGELPSGLTQSGLGSKTYANSPKIGFDTTDDNLILKIQGGVPAVLSFDIKGNSFSGGTFKVQTSVDGETYSDIATFTELGATTTEQYYIPANICYIKWVYTEKVNGNVALGNIILYKGALVKFNSNGYATFACPAALDFSDSEAGYSAWQVTGVAGESIYFSQIESKVAAGTGILLKGEAYATVTLELADSGDDISETNKLEGITEATEVAADTYFGLKGNEFVKVNAGTIAAGKAVLPVGVLPAGVKSLTFNFNGVPTGVNGVETVDAENARIFNLAGQRLSTPQKGLNIVNGKKVLVK